MTPIKILAVIQFNKGEAYVLNRHPEYVYQRDGDILWACDTGFYSVYKYDAPRRPINPNWSGWRAFAGRKFTLPMKDGTITECHGQYWDAGQGELSKKLNITLEHVTMETIPELQKCYVFCGSSIESEYRKKLRAEYTGCVYPYSEYEKIIKYDDMRHSNFKREWKLERAKKSLIKEVRKFHGMVHGKYTPEKYQQLTGKPWPEDAAVYYRTDMMNEWEIDSYYYYLENVKPQYIYTDVLCATGLPPRIGEVVG